MPNKAWQALLLKLLLNITRRSIKIKPIKACPTKASLLMRLNFMKIARLALHVKYPRLS